MTINDIQIHIIYCKDFYPAKVGYWVERLKEAATANLPPNMAEVHVKEYNDNLTAIYNSNLSETDRELTRNRNFLLINHYLTTK